MPLTLARRTATTGRSGSLAACLSVPAPWYHGPAHFRGHVDNRFDARGGYHGPLPNHGDRPADSAAMNIVTGEETLCIDA